MSIGNGSARLGRMVDWSAVVRCGESAGGEGGGKGGGGARSSMLPHHTKTFGAPPLPPTPSEALVYKQPSCFYSDVSDVTWKLM